MPDPIDWAHAAPYLLAALAFGYLLGSIPFGLLLTKAAGLGDIRRIGSGNIGATNVLRTGRKGLAAATLACDFGKGFAAAAIPFAVAGPDAAHIAALGALLGHLFPVWLKFKGGKGVAVAGGAMTGLFWPIGLIAAATWVAMAFAFRISSLSALTAALAAPLAAYLFGRVQTFEILLIVAALVWFAHRENVKRLIAGEEPKIGAKAKGCAT